MAILGSFVAFRRAIVADDRMSQQMKDVVAKMLERLPRHDTKVSYQYELQVYHFLVENEIVYGCVTPPEYENRLVYGFLNQVKDLFKTQFAGSSDRYPRPDEVTYTNCGKFRSTLASSTRTFNEDPQADKIGKIKEQLTSTKQVMLENLDSILERGDRIDGLCDRTELLREEAQGFSSNARSLKRAQIKHNIMLGIGVVVILAVLALVIAFMACGIDFKKC